MWAVVPTNLVEAERKGAKLVQRLAEISSASPTGMALTDATNPSKKAANGHKEEGTSHFAGLLNVVKYGWP